MTPEPLPHPLAQQRPMTEGVQLREMGASKTEIAKLLLEQRAACAAENAEFLKEVKWMLSDGRVISTMVH
jgi:hypothetical protein